MSGGRAAAPLSGEEIEILRMLAGRKMPGTLRYTPERTRLYRLGLIESERSAYATKSEGVNYTLTRTGRVILAGLEDA